MTSAEYLAGWPEEGRDQLARILRKAMMQAVELRQTHRVDAGNGPSCGDRPSARAEMAPSPSNVEQEAAQ